MKPVYATIKDFEIMRMFKKGQFNMWMYVNRDESLLLMSCLDYRADLCLKFRF